LEINLNAEVLDSAGELPDQSEIEKEVIESNVKVEGIDIDQTQIIGKKRKRTESEISENELQVCKEEYLEESNDEIVKIDDSENPVSHKVQILKYRANVSKNVLQ
jgi:predicted GTPase